MEKKDKEEFLMKSLVESGLLKAGDAFLTLCSPLTLPGSKREKKFCLYLLQERKLYIILRRIVFFF